MRVAVIGRGDRIDALLELLKRNEKDVVTAQIGDAKTTGAVPVVSPEELRDIHLIFINGPMVDFRETCRALGDHISGRHAVVHLVHDLEPVSLNTASEVIEQETATHRVGFLTGPMRSVDVCNERPSAGLIASPFGEVIDLTVEQIVNPLFRVYTNKDLKGAEYIAAYCRVIAFAAGIVSAAQLGDSVHATLFARGLAEGARFTAQFGCDVDTTHGLAGTANLFISATEPGSLDFQAGAKVVQMGKFVYDDVVELGPEVSSLVVLIDNLLENAKHEDHILQMCAAITSAAFTPQDAIRNLMSLPVLSE